MRLNQNEEHMMRIGEVSQDSGGLLVKVAYWLSRKRFGKIATPLKVMCHHFLVLLGSGAFEMAFERSKKVDWRLKELALIKVATMVGCPW
jgi:hypothetical protein